MAGWFIKSPPPLLLLFLVALLLLVLLDLLVLLVVVALPAFLLQPAPAWLCRLSLRPGLESCLGTFECIKQVQHGARAIIRWCLLHEFHIGPILLSASHDQFLNCEIWFGPVVFDQTKSGCMCLGPPSSTLAISWPALPSDTGGSSRIARGFGHYLCMYVGRPGGGGVLKVRKHVSNLFLLHLAGLHPILYEHLRSSLSSTPFLAFHEIHSPPDLLVGVLLEALVSAQDFLYSGNAILSESSLAESTNRPLPMKANRFSLLS